MSQDSEIVAPDGRPARQDAARSTRCPRCGAGEDRRVKSSAFGKPHDVCAECGCEDLEMTE